MFDIAGLLNTRLQDSDVWSFLAETYEDAMNRLVGDATQEAMRADNGYRFLRGDIVDPRIFPNLLAVDPTAAPDYTALVAKRVREGVVNVCYPILEDDPLVIQPGDNAILYIDVDGHQYWTPVQRTVSRQLLISEAKYHGFDYFSDTLSTADYARVVEHIGQYWPEAGSSTAFPRFLGFIKDIRVDLDQLWTEEDENEFFTSLLPRTISTVEFYDGGIWYPTSHYNLHYDLLTTSQNPQELRSLFYLLAPIHLVLQALIPTIFSDVLLNVVGVSCPTTFERGDFDCDAFLLS